MSCSHETHSTLSFFPSLVFCNWLAGILSSVLAQYLLFSIFRCTKPKWQKTRLEIYGRTALHALIYTVYEYSYIQHEGRTGGTYISPSTDWSEQRGKWAEWHMASDAAPSRGRGGFYDSSPCGPFEVHSFHSALSQTHGLNPDTHTMRGGRGGHWTACTHLKGYAAYGLNLAPFFLRFLAFALQPKSAFELGCGLGTTADYLARFTPGGSAVTCAEPSEMLAEVFGKRPLPMRPSQLAVNLFPEEGTRCRQFLCHKGFDLTYSIEVAEHIKAVRRNSVIRLLSNASRRFVVFSAARPGQAGTGHLQTSMLWPKDWRRLFESAGLVYLPILTDFARNLSYPERGYDIAQNVLVLRVAAATDVDELAIISRAQPLCDRAWLHPSHPRPYGFNSRRHYVHKGPQGSKKDAPLTKEWRSNVEETLFPELSALSRLFQDERSNASASDGVRSYSYYC